MKTTSYIKCIAHKDAELPCFAKIFAILIFLYVTLTPRMECSASSYHAADSIAQIMPDYEKNDLQKQSVGLVLSGGGAKGIAHVGVIKALEDNDIPIDYVTGTSMGAIVGSLYCAGWSPEQMIDFFTSKEFNYFATGTVDPSFTYYFSNPDPSPRWISLNINPADTTISLLNQVVPTHLINALPMNMEFLKLYAPYTLQCKENFNNLFVPFRCVTSDVYHKRKIVCKSGSLGDAVRASMSFPLVFKPIKMDGVLVYDGGIYDNFPVDVMQQDFNPDFIIGVSVSSPDSKPQANNIYSQLEDMIIQNNNYTVPAKNGIKIQVPVLNFGVLDFQQGQEIYDIGYKTGMAMVDSIKSRVKSRRDLSEVTRRREQFSLQTPNVEFDNVDVEGATPRQARYIKYIFDPKRNHPFDLQQVQNAYYRVATDGKLNNLLPQAIFNADGKNTLLLEANVKQPWNIGVGGWITSSTHSMLYVDFGYHTLSFNSLDLDLSGWIGQSYYAGRAAAKFAMHSSLPSYMQLEFVVSRQKYYDTELLFYQNSSPSFITDREIFFRLNYCMALGRKGKLTAGLGYGWLRDSYYPIGTKDYALAKKNFSNYRSFDARVETEWNTLNDPMYPSAGRMIKANALFSLEKNSLHVDGEKEAAIKYKSQPTFSVEGVWTQYFPVHKNFRIGANTTIMASLMKLYQNYTATLIHSPAFAPTPSTKNYFNPAFRSPNYLAAGVMPVWLPLQKLQLRGDFYIYSPIRHMAMTSSSDARYQGWFHNVEFIGEVAAVYNFSFASISLYGNYLSYPARNWNFGINFGMLIQAPRLVR